jgi:ABC-type multidrug transport system ATPase subunit
MGDSGAGKSTLINVLTGIYHPVNGAVTINGFDIHKDPAKVKGLIGYVSQDDLLMEDLTVMQNLYYNAKLCFNHLSTPNIKRKVTKLLKSLGLYEIRHMKVGSPLNPAISGGQRKRLNIALELIREPAVMFMDEPTSGLSSRDSENILDLLKELSLKGKLIFVVIHQPSSVIFKMFDQLLVLDTGGYLVYNGDAVESINYFKKCINHVNRDETECPLCGNVSPEQILTIVNSHVLDEYGNPTSTRRIAADEWYQTYKKEVVENKPGKKGTSLPQVNFSIPGRLKQLWIFMTRDILSKLSNRQYLLINLLEAPVLALVLAYLVKYIEVGSGSLGSYVFYKNPNLTVYNIMAIIIAIFIGLSVSAEEIISDRKIRKRESFLNLSRFSYICSKVIILACLSAIQTGLFVLIGNSILEIKGMGPTYWYVLFASSVFANLLGLNISDSFKKTVNIYILIPFLIIPQLILSGVFVSYDQMNPNVSSAKTIPWYGEFITARWAFEAITVEYYKTNEYQKHFYVHEKLKSVATYRKDFWIPEIKNQLNRYPKLEQESDKVSVLKLVKHEIERHNDKNLPGLTFSSTELLTPNKFDAAALNLINQHLDSARVFYVGLYRKADEMMEQKKQAFMTSNGGVDWLNNLRNDHHNEGIDRFLRRSNDIFSSKVIQYKHELVQKFDPIYEDPESTLLKAHFLAPTKNLNGTYFNTYRVNLIIIWIMNLALFILLYASLFKRLYNWGNAIRKKYETNLLSNQDK